MRLMHIPLNRQITTREKFLADLEETYWKFIAKDEPRQTELLDLLRNVVGIVYDLTNRSGYVILCYKDDGSFYFEVKRFLKPPSAVGGVEIGERPEDGEKILADAKKIGVEMTISEGFYEGIKKRTDV